TRLVRGAVIGCDGDQAVAPARVDDRLIAEIDHDAGCELVERATDGLELGLRLYDRQVAERYRAAQLLSPTEHHGRDHIVVGTQRRERVQENRWVVLTIHEDERAPAFCHVDCCSVTSGSSSR